jgi:hypothetical protein
MSLSKHVAGSLFGMLAFTIAYVVYLNEPQGAGVFLSLGALFGASLYALVYSATEAVNQ